MNPRHTGEHGVPKCQRGIQHAVLAGEQEIIGRLLTDETPIVHYLEAAARLPLVAP